MAQSSCRQLCAFLSKISAKQPEIQKIIAGARKPESTDVNLHKMRLTKFICTKLPTFPSRKISCFLLDHDRDEEPDYAGISHLHFTKTLLQAPNLIITPISETVAATQSFLDVSCVQMPIFQHGNLNLCWRLSRCSDQENMWQIKHKELPVLRIRRDQNVYGAAATIKGGHGRFGSTQKPLYAQGGLNGGAACCWRWFLSLTQKIV